MKGKKFGIVVGEAHNLQGAKCFEVLLIELAKVAGIRHLLVELSPKSTSELSTKHRYNMGYDIGLLQILIEEAQRAQMKVIPIDIIDIDREKQNSEFFEGMKELYFTGKKREENFINKILRLKENFIFVTGADHLSSLYYDPQLNDKFSLLFFNCAPPMSQKKKDMTELIC